MGKNFKSEISNTYTENMYYFHLLMLACSVFEYQNLPENIKNIELEKYLVQYGSVCFFNDSVLGLIALPFRAITPSSKFNVMPENIVAFNPINNYEIILKENEYVLMYDNNIKYNINMDIKSYAIRISQMRRTIDININQQKTNRFFLTTPENEKTIKDTINAIDRFDNQVLSYRNLITKDLTTVLEPAPFVSDKIENSIKFIINEFCDLIGLNNPIEKSERLINAEIEVNNVISDTFKSSRLISRKNALSQINSKFNTNIQVY